MVFGPSFTAMVFGPCEGVPWPEPCSTKASCKRMQASWQLAAQEGREKQGLKLVSRQFRKQRLAVWAADRGPDPHFTAMVFWLCETGPIRTSLPWCFGSARPSFDWSFAGSAGRRACDKVLGPELCRAKFLGMFTLAALTQAAPTHQLYNPFLSLFHISALFPTLPCPLQVCCQASLIRSSTYRHWWGLFLSLAPPSRCEKLKKSFGAPRSSPPGMSVPWPLPCVQTSSNSSSSWRKPPKQFLLFRPFSAIPC